MQLLPYSIRTQGPAVQIAVSDAALTVNQYVSPIALDNIGYWYFVFYLGMLLIGTAVISFAFPETKAYTLEQLAKLFEEKDRLPLLMLSVCEKSEMPNDDPKSTKFQIKETESGSWRI